MFNRLFTVPGHGFRSRQPPSPPTSAKLSSRWSSRASSRWPPARSARAPRTPPSSPALWRTWEMGTRSSAEAVGPFLTGFSGTENLDPENRVKECQDPSYLERLPGTPEGSQTCHLAPNPQLVKNDICKDF